MKPEKSSGASLRASLLLNAVFLMLAVILLRVGFESNDDPTLSAFVDGQMAHSTAYIPYLNIVFGALLKLVYTVLGQEAAWYTCLQYALLFAGLMALCFCVCRRVGVRRGLVVSAVLLLFFGADVYAIISYTKTAAVCAVGGAALLLYASETDGRHIAALTLGGLLCLFGFMLRPLEFLPCFGMTAALCLRPLWDRLAGTASAGEKLRKIGRLALPYLMVLALCAGLYAVDEAAWSREPWRGYHEFDRVRVAYSDYGRPAYREMPEAYEELGLSQTDVQLLYEGNYFDPAVFSAETMQAISDKRDEVFPRPTAGECLGVLLDKVLPGFFRELPVYGLLLILILWLAAGDHSLRVFLCLGAWALLFAAAYLYLIYRGRYLVDRVDLGLLLSGAAVLSLTLDKSKLERENLLPALVLALALGTCHYLVRDQYRSAPAEDNSAARAACETLLSDREHVYLAKLDTVADGLWSPFEPYGKGYWDRIVLLGGFDCLHPRIMENLAAYGVENPYRDCVGNDRVYLIEDDVELTLAFIREHYDPHASAQRVEPLSSDTGLDIYRILE